MYLSGGNSSSVRAKEKFDGPEKPDPVRDLDIDRDHLSHFKIGTHLLVRFQCPDHKTGLVVGNIKLPVIHRIVSPRTSDRLISSRLDHLSGSQLPLQLLAVGKEIFHSVRLAFPDRSCCIHRHRPQLWSPFQDFLIQCIFSCRALSKKIIYPAHLFLSAFCIIIFIPVR